MTKASIQELIEFLRTATNNTVPYKNSQMVAAVKDAASLRDMASLEQLSDAMVDAYVRLNPDKPHETMVRNAIDTIATLAYLADHSPSSDEWITLGPVKAYMQRHQYGNAMTLVKRIYDKRQIDLMRDIFKADVRSASN